MPSTGHKPVKTCGGSSGRRSTHPWNCGAGSCFSPSCRRSRAEQRPGGPRDQGVQMDPRMGSPLLCYGAVSELLRTAGANSRGIIASDRTEVPASRGCLRCPRSKRTGGIPKVVPSALDRYSRTCWVLIGAPRGGRVGGKPVDLQRCCGYNGRTSPLAVSCRRKPRRSPTGRW